MYTGTQRTKNVFRMTMTLHQHHTSSVSM